MGHMIPEMLLPDGAATAFTTKNQQATHIGIGQVEGLALSSTPVLTGATAMRAANRRVIGITEIPELQELFKG